MYSPNNYSDRQSLTYCMATKLTMVPTVGSKIIRVLEIILVKELIIILSKKTALDIPNAVL